MMTTVREMGLVRFIGVGVILWLVRLLALIPFLDENGSVPSVSADGRIPANVEYFFSVLIFVVTLTTLLGVAYLLGRRTTVGPLAQGVVIAVGLLVVVAIFDLLFTVVIGGRSPVNWFRNLALDYSPLILIPVVVGWILQRHKAT